MRRRRAARLEFGANTEACIRSQRWHAPFRRDSFAVNVN
jgi:hypothetical protein